MRNSAIWMSGLVMAAVLGAPLAAAVPVTVDNFKRAETELYMKLYADRGFLGVVGHDRVPPPAEKQPVIRMNRDTLYSYVVLDLTSPATIVKPDTGKRFQSAIVINQDHYIKKVAYGPGPIELTKENVGTRYAIVVFRTFLNPDDPKDVAAAHAAQDGIRLIQADKGRMEPTDFDQAQRAKLHEMLNALTPFQPDPKGRFGDVGKVNPVNHLIYTAAGWGGNAPEDATYVFGSPEANDGTTPHVMTLKDVPVSGFWSVTVYNKDGYFEPPASAVSLNNVTAKPNKDGSYTLRFGGDPKAPNYLRIMPGWNYALRLYRPGPSVLDGSWVPPTAVPAK